MPSVTNLTDRYTAAVEAARQVHDGELRKGTSVPYFSHPLSVSAIVLEHGGSEDQAIAALLHDAAEDHGGQARLDEIRAQFGPHVADLVEACSDTLVADRNSKEPWWDRKIRYLVRLERESADVALVSAADKLHNARSVLADYRRLGDELWTRFNSDAGRAGSLWYYTRLSEVLQRLLVDEPGSLLAAELARTVDQIKEQASRLGHDPDADVAAGEEREKALRAPGPEQPT